MTLELTDQQVAVIEAWRAPEGPNMLVDAVAGSGKSFTLKKAAHAASEISPLQSVLAIAFNKAIADALQKDMPANVEARTLNSLGHRAWGQYLGGRMELDAAKMRKITSLMFKEPGLEGLDELYMACLQLASAAKVVGLVPTTVKHPYTKGLVSDTAEDWEQLAYVKDIDFSVTINRISRAILTISVKQALDGLIDFDDQLYMPVCYGAPVQKYDRIMVDEAQDLNPIQHVLVAKSVGKNSRLMVVGDPYQSIYGFRGAVSGSMGVLEKKFNMETFPLSCSFRCPKLVVAEAKKIVPHIESFPEAKEGFVSHILEWDADTFKPGDAILCRYNAPLVSVAYELIRGGKAPKMLGRDLGAGLKALINKVSGKKKGMQIGKLKEFLENWKDLETRNAKARDDDRKILSIEDKFSSLMIILYALDDEQPVQVALNEVDKIFDSKVGNIILASIHKAKGLEWETVYFLNSYDLPPWQVIKKAESGYDWAEEALQQEYNLIYVADTRAMNELNFIQEEMRE